MFTCKLNKIIFHHRSWYGSHCPPFVVFFKCFPNLLYMHVTVVVKIFGNGEKVYQKWENWANAHVCIGEGFMGMHIKKGKWEVRTGHEKNNCDMYFKCTLRREIVVEIPL